MQLQRQLSVDSELCLTPRPQIGASRHEIIDNAAPSTRPLMIN